MNFLYNLKPNETIEWYTSTILDLDENDFDVIGPGHPEYDELKMRYYGRLPAYEEVYEIEDKSLSPYSLIIRRK